MLAILYKSIASIARDLGAPSIEYRSIARDLRAPSIEYRSIGLGGAILCPGLKLVADCDSDFLAFETVAAHTMLGEAKSKFFIERRAG